MRLEADGGVHLPIEACQALGWAPGDELELARSEDRLQLRRVRPEPEELRQAGSAALVTAAVRREFAAALMARGVQATEAERAAAALG